MNTETWQTVTTDLFNDLKEDEFLVLSLEGEDSLFVRMTQAKVRQSTQVFQYAVKVQYFKGQKSLTLTIPFSFQTEKDLVTCREALHRCREEITHLPEDPFLQIPNTQGNFYQGIQNKVDRDQVLHSCLQKVQGLDFVGLLTAGEVVRANAHSKGLNQWFEASTFVLDFSLYAANRQAVKGIYGASSWEDDHYTALLGKKNHQLDHLNRPQMMTLDKGKYRVYLSASAVATIIEGFSFNGVSQGAYQQGECALRKLVDGEKTLSNLFSLHENFTAGVIPRFNGRGEVAPEVLPLIQEGRFQNLLCSSRTAKEYGVESNFANSGENLRSPEILPGNLAHECEEALLGTGIYISDLHYLNWSDVQEGRLTGMTRFGTFWVENGQIVAPVKDMRFDESLYHFWGTGLEGLTSKTEAFPKTGTYYQRDLGQIKAPGMIVNDFTLVL